MKQMMNKALFEATARTFEELAFLPANPEPVEPQDAPAPVLASVEFAGPFRGRLDVVVPDVLLPVLAANMLGTDETPPLNQQLDALCEIANVIAGHFLPDFAGPDMVFELNPPKLCFGENQQPAARPSAGEAAIFFDEGVAEVRLYMDQVPAAGPVRHD